MPSPNVDALRLLGPETALVIVDVQERLAQAMPEAPRFTCERNITMLVELARRLDLPVLLSEQYPKGLGPTVPSIAAALSVGPLRVFRLEKMHFACTDAPEFDALYAAMGRTRFVVVGMESHVCVFQTVRGLVGRGASVFVPADAVVSRTPDNRSIGLDLCARAGAVVTSTEAVVFDLLGRAGTDDFKAMSRLVK